MSQLTIKKYSPIINELIDATQDDYDIINYKLQLIYTIMRITEIQKLIDIRKWMNENVSINI